MCVCSFIGLCLSFFVFLFVYLFMLISLACVVVVVARSVLDIYHLFCKAFELYRFGGMG